LPTWVPKTRINIIKRHREHSGNFQGTFGEHSVRVEVDARWPASQLQEALEESTKVNAAYNLPTWVPKTRINKTKRFREHSGNIRGTIREHSGNEMSPAGT
jgi:hypothetical protein